MNGRSLLQYIRKYEQVLQEEELLDIHQDKYCCGMEYLESKNIIHG
jgi:hypothetical protein